MSYEYVKYLQQHKRNVLKGYCWLEDNIPEIFNNSLSEMTHHGIKGQKWGIRRNKQELELTRKNDIIVLEAIDSGTVSTVINRHKQDRHTESGHLPGRSYVKGNLEYSQKLVDQYSGTGRPSLDSKGNWTNKERVKADIKVGVHIDQDGEETETANLIIIYSKTGTHVYPGKGYNNEK